VEFATRRDTTNDADAEKFMQRFGGRMVRSEAKRQRQELDAVAEVKIDVGWTKSSARAQPRGHRA